jgi:hypothetical protein
MKPKGLFINMPRVVKAAISTQIPLERNLAMKMQNNADLGMFQAGLLQNFLKPVVAARLHKVINSIRLDKVERQNSTEEAKRHKEQHAASLIMMGASTRGFNYKLCQKLWSEKTELSSKLSALFCPTIMFLPGDADLETHITLGRGPPSRVRSARLSNYFWTAMVSYAMMDGVEQLAPDVCFVESPTAETCGKHNVQLKLPTIGWPEETMLQDPAYWYCDATSCLVTIQAWAYQKNFCYAAFNSEGQVVEAIVPLRLWR